MTREILSQCTIEGNVVKLPATQLDRKLYVEVKNKLELIGGKWKGGNINGFVFKEDPSDLLSQIALGHDTNLKKKYQYFATPDFLADDLLSYVLVKGTDRILEPSAGQGALINAIHRVRSSVTVDCYELMDINRSILEKLPNVNVIGSDFLACTTKDYYNLVVANPPFTKNQDIDHILKMYEVTAPGGTIATMASTSWQTGGQKKQKEFRDWLEDIGVMVIDVDAGAFKESGTNVRSVLLIIDKPLNA